MVIKIEKNYAGFNDKATASNRAKYERLTDSLRQVADTANTVACLHVMNTWLEFFRDNHVYAFINEDPSNHPEIRKLFDGGERMHVTEQALRSYLDSHPAPDPLEGIWEDETKRYRIGIMRRKATSEFTGFILQADSLYWMPGQVKMKIRKSAGRYELTAFFARDHSVSAPPITVGNDVFTIRSFGNWYRVDPRKPGNAGKPAEKSDTPYFRILDTESCLLAIPSAMLEHKATIDSLLQLYDATIKQARHFIIDLRGNMGGSVLCFEKLLPLLYTNPIITKGASVLATEENIKNNYEVGDYPNISDSMKAVFAKEAKELRQHIGTMYNLWPGDTLTFDTVFRYPQKVSIIIDGYCASSTELFLIKARQSSKVTLYGTHTMGAVDYTDAVTVKLPCRLFSLRYATARSNRLPAEPIDNTGIPPQVKIPGHVKDWVAYVRNLNQRSSTMK